MPWAWTGIGRSSRVKPSEATQSLSKPSIPWTTEAVVRWRRDFGRAICLQISQVKNWRGPGEDPRTAGVLRHSWGRPGVVLQRFTICAGHKARRRRAGDDRGPGGIARPMSLLPFTPQTRSRRALWRFLDGALWASPVPALYFGRSTGPAARPLGCLDGGKRSSKTSNREGPCNHTDRCAPRGLGAC